MKRNASTSPSDYACPAARANPRKAYTFFKERGRNVVKDSTVMKLNAQAVNYGTQRYQMLIHSRTKMVGRILESGWRPGLLLL